MPDELPDQLKAAGEFPNAWLLARKIGIALENLDTDIEDWSGHFKKGTHWYKSGHHRSSSQRFKDLVSGLYWTLQDKPIDDLTQIMATLEAGVKLDAPIKLGRPSLGRDFICPFCGEKLFFGFDGERVCVMSDPCDYPEGLITEFELNVPSGKIVVNDSLSQWFRTDSEDRGGMFGTHQASLDAAAVGLAHGFVGNTCPSVFKIGDRFVIGNWPEELYDEETYEDYPNPDPCPWGEQVASIMTDLWWYSIADYDEFMRRVEHYTPDMDVEKFLGSVNVVSVKPGVYRFCQDQGINRDPQIVKFASFEWVRDPDPVQDFLTEDLSKDLTPAEVLIQSCLDYPTLYMPERNPDAQGTASLGRN